MHNTIWTEQQSIGGGRIRARWQNIPPHTLGQFFLLDVGWTAPIPIFPGETTATGDGGAWVELPPAHPAQPLLAVAAPLIARGPFGKGVPALVECQHLLIASSTLPERVLPFAWAALARGASVSILLGRPYPLAALPIAAEVYVGHIPNLLAQTPNWADGLLIQTEPWQQCLAFAQKSLCPSYICLPFSPPCGNGICASCAVQTQAGWQLTCQAGLILSANTFPNSQTLF
jgi:hypothetical protein